jgi:predicted nucleotidyltransferase
MVLTSEMRSTLLDQVPSLQLLVLFGSRARGDHNDESDWDFAALYADQEQNSRKLLSADPHIVTHLVLADIFNLPDHQVDVVNLTQVSTLMSHFIAQDGKLIYECEPEIFSKFQLQFRLSFDALKRHQKQSRQRLLDFLATQNL